MFHPEHALVHRENCPRAISSSMPDCTQSSLERGVVRTHGFDCLARTSGHQPQLGTELAMDSGNTCDLDDVHSNLYTRRPVEVQQQNTSDPGSHALLKPRSELHHMEVRSPAPTYTDGSASGGRLWDPYQPLPEAIIPACRTTESLTPHMNNEVVGFLKRSRTIEECMATLKDMLVRRQGVRQRMVRFITRQALFDKVETEDIDDQNNQNESGPKPLWYCEKSNELLNTDWIQRHLFGGARLLATPNLMEHLTCWYKAFATVDFLVNPTTSIVPFFGARLEHGDALWPRYRPAEFAFLDSNAELIMSRLTKEQNTTPQILPPSSQNSHRLEIQGLDVAAAPLAATPGWSWDNSYSDKISVPRSPIHSAMTVYNNSEDVVADVLLPVFGAINVERNITFMHSFLTNSLNLSCDAGALIYIEQCVPWNEIVRFLNTVGRSGVSFLPEDYNSFPASYGGHGRQLPEDFLMRSILTARHDYESDFFAGQLVDEDEHDQDEGANHQHKEPLGAESNLWRAFAGRLRRWLDAKRFNLLSLSHKSNAHSEILRLVTVIGMNALSCKKLKLVLC